MSNVSTKHYPCNGRTVGKRDFLVHDINDLVQVCHQDQVDAGWWHDKDGNPLERNYGELLCLVHSEISESMEGDRKGLMDDKLPQYEMRDVEIADALIRLCDLAGARGINLGQILVDKLAFNRQRADHKRENRELPGGKKY